MAHRGGTVPDHVRKEILGGIEFSSLERNEVFNTLVGRFAKIASEDVENLEKNFVLLDKTADKKVVKVKSDRTIKKLTYRKRKEMGLYNIGRKSIKYSDLLPLYELWKDYMADYLNLKELKIQNWKNNPADSSFESVSQKLYRADYHGSKMTVIQSKCLSLVDVQGLVVMETKNCFKLVGSDNIVRTIPKASSVFMIHLDKFNLKFFGKNLEIRPAERSSKKIKTSLINDL